MHKNCGKRKAKCWFVVCMAVLFAAAGVFADEDYSQWSYSKIIILNTSARGANVSDRVVKFPVLIRLTSDNFSFNQAQDNGADIRFGKADGKQLSYQIERWDRDRQVAEVWVLVDTIKGNDSTQSIRMFWGKNDAFSQSNGAAVFKTSNGFTAVYHIEEERAGTGNVGVYKDVTANGYNGTDNIRVTGQEGVIGNGHQFGIGDNIYLGKFDPSPIILSLSAWVKLGGSNSQYQVIFAKRNRWSPSAMRWQLNYAADLHSLIFSTAVSMVNFHTDTVLTPGQWCHVVLTSTNGGTAKLYINGTQVGGDKIMRWDNRTDADVRIGGTDVNAESWNGFIDEAIIASVIRSPAWIKLCYENQKPLGQTLVKIEDYSLWPYSQRIYFNTTSSGANVMGDVRNFPFLVRLNAGNFDFSKATFNGADIRFSDPNGTQLSYEIEHWDVINQIAAIWVKVPKIDGNSLSDFIVMYYGNTLVPDMQDRQGVWDNTVAGIWHMKESQPGYIIDKFCISNKGRSSDWIKLWYENQKPNSKLQVTLWTSVPTIFDGSISNKKSGFDNSNPTMKLIHTGDNPKTDTLSHILLQFDTREAAKLQNQGWALENASLHLTVDSLSTPLFCDSAYMGIYTSDRLLPVDRHDGFRPWREDGSMGDSAINMNGTKYRHGISGQPDLSGNWAWVLYNFQSEIKRLNFIEVDSITWSAGTQDNGGGVETFVKMSSLSNAPPDSLWEHGGIGITERQHTLLGQKNQNGHITSGFNTIQWLWLATKRTGVDTSACGVWGNFNIYGKKQKDAKMLLYQVKSDSINTNHLSWSYRGNDLPWRHDASEQDFGTDSAEGIGTEDLVQVYPGHSPLWNRYKEKYRSRSPVAIVNISSSLIFNGDTGFVYFGVDSIGKLLPSARENGCYPFRENRRADSSTPLKMNDTVYNIGVGGTAAGSGNYPYLLYNLRTEAARLNFGKLFAIRGKAGHCDGSDSVEVIIKTCTTTVQPTLSAWINNAAGVKERVRYISWRGSHYSEVNITTDSCGGPASNIKWVWLSVSSTKGTGATRLGAFAELRIEAEIKTTNALSIQNNILSQMVQKALSDTTHPYITLLGVCKDSATKVSFISSRSSDIVFRPRLDFKFSDSKTLLSWEGQNNRLSIPKGEPITLMGNPPVGDGRYGRVLSYHNHAAQYSQISDSSHIDYSQGSVSFWYQMNMGAESDSGANAIFFKRNVTGNTQFKFQRDGSSARLNFYFGDTTADSNGVNRMIWQFIDSTVDEIDTIGHDTTWHKNTLVNPFDGSQHFFSFTWDYNAKSVSLAIDGKSLLVNKPLTFRSSPVSWAKANLIFGQNVDGYLENLVIHSKITAPAAITVAQTVIDTINGYLPYIQPAFNDTVDCIVISPDDVMFREVCDKYAFRNISMGIRTAVVSMGQINRYYPGSDEQERIRNFLKQAYLSWHSKWVILAGSPLFIPPRKVAFQSQGGNEVTTDRYYACLEGSWNDNGNEYFAEPEDNADMTAELIVGRLPANTWSELRSMFERSTMGFGLPPYREQCLGNSDTVAISGIRMFGNMGEVSDGQYYGNMLKDILQKGAYTGGLHIKTYYPNDDPTNNDSQTVDFRLNKFLDFLCPLPGMWVHFGHGNYANYQVDWILGQWPKRVMLTINHLTQLRQFNLFRQMSHFRLVGCESNSINLSSFGKALSAKRYGGPLSVVSVSEFSYPVVESSLLEEEFRNIADSTLFTWGEAFGRSADEVLAGSGSWDITRWVVFSRNYLGDPLMPVRYKKLQADDTLAIQVLGEVKKGEDSIVVTVTDKTGGPVEGASVGLVSRKIVAATSDTAVLVGKTVNDLAFARGITNRQGKVTLKFKASYEDSVTVTAMHNDYIPSRKSIGVSDSISGIYIYWQNSWDYNSDPSMNFDGIFEASDNVSYSTWLYSEAPLDSGRADIVFDTAGTGIKVDSTTIGISRYKNGPYIIGGTFLLKEVPPGVKNLKFRISLYQSTSGTTPCGEFTMVIPVTGVKIIPIITYLYNQRDSTVFPSGGADVNMQILIGNNYSAKAQKVRCEVIDYNTSFCTISPAVTDTHSINPWSAAKDSAIMIHIASGYSEEVNGIITAKLRITGSNVKPDTLNIDLNPLRNVAIKMAAKGPELDYNQGVRLQWEPLRFNGNNRRSDFRGYVLLRSVHKDSVADILTSSPITSTCYYYDKLPDSGSATYTYRIIAVDSSYNFSAETLITITRPPFVKKGFPIYTGKEMQAPLIGNFDKDNKAEIYTANSGPILGYRSDGQEAYVKGENDGVVVDPAQQMITADVNGDGFDDAIYATSDSLIAFDLKNKSRLWAATVQDGPHCPINGNGSLLWLRPLMVADVNGDGWPEIIAYSFDNCATTLDLYDHHNGKRLARKTFIDGGYSPALAVGDFKKGNGDSLEIFVVSRDALGGDWTKYYLYFLDGYDSVHTTFHVSDSIKVSDIVANGQAWAIVSSKLSVGKLYGGSDTLQVVLKTGGWQSSNAKDTIFAYSIDRNTGKFIRNGSDPVRAFYPVSFSVGSIYGSSAALGDINGDGKEEIVFAGDDTIYVLKMVRLDSLALVQKIPFGNIPTHRIETSGGNTAQALIVNFNNDSTPEIIANHQGDGAIWAFKKDSTGMYKLKGGFPLEVKGRVFESCNITDLDGDGILDLTAVDQAGYMFAWKLDSGSVNKQMWPAPYGNNWNTGYREYREAGNIGYLYEDWKADRVAPYAWIESGPNNATDTVTSGNVFIRKSGVMQTDASGDRNLHFTGLGTKNWQNYTVSGKIRFDSANAEFGINVYSQFTDAAKKYTILRRPDGRIQ